MKHYKTLEFDKILEMLASHARSDNAKKLCIQLSPANSLQDAERKINETTQAKKIIENVGTPPIATMADLDKTLGLLGVDALLTPEQVGHVYTFLMACRRLKEYLKRAESTGSDIAYYGGSIALLPELENEIDRCIRNGQVDDRASQILLDIRRKISSTGEQIKSKLDGLLRKNKAWFSEAFVSVRGGHYTLPVKREHKHDVQGSVIEISNTGGTCFIEPTSVRKLQDELGVLYVEEDCEVRRILYTLAAMIDEALPSIRLNIEAMEILDFLFAKAYISIAMNGSPVRISTNRELRILSARHPLLNAATAVPLDFSLGDGISGVIITGPNTGGKTVALKTVGLLSLMAQSGLHVPADSQSTFCINDTVLCDIGDGQSISENLSTFSSHITNIIDILKTSSKTSLVLLDELGSGTDPAEGMGIATAIIEELLRLGCLFVATTHYPEIKELANTKAGLINARMAFDRDSLVPLYRLEIGESGESCALYIAERLGLSAHMLTRAREAAYSVVKPKSEQTAPNKSSIIEVKPLAVEQTEEKPLATPRSQRFSLGESVTVYPQKDIGIVYAKANEKGEIGVLVKGKKLLINHKRLQLKVAATELYPADYDFSIVFDSVANRKARHVMEKKHVEGNTVIIKE